jgi:hypothetical protein
MRRLYVGSTIFTDNEINDRAEDKNPFFFQSTSNLQPSLFDHAGRNRSPILTDGYHKNITDYFIFLAAGGRLSYQMPATHFPFQA